MRIVIAGGGTGGHVMPALALVEELRRRDPQLFLRWVGKRGSLEERMAARHNIPFVPVSVTSWVGKPWHTRVLGLSALGFGILKSAEMLLRFRPQIVVGVGGYASFPTVWAAQRLGFKTALLEQNVALGFANRILAARATRIFLSYSPLEKYPFPDKIRVFGNPIRGSFRNPPPRDEARRRWGLNLSAPVVLVVGGSQGSARINEAVAGATHHLADQSLQWLWMTGPSANHYRERVTPSARLQIFEFIEDMVSAYAAADVVICRAGASTLAELAAVGVPAILVPYPHAAEGHQMHNAQRFVEAGAARIVSDAECTAERLAREIETLLASPESLAAMRERMHALAAPHAAEEIASEIISLVFA